MTDRPTAPEDLVRDSWGGWADADRLRREAFLRRTPAQRLAWLTEALELAYTFGALAPPVAPGAGDETGPAPDALPETGD